MAEKIGPREAGLRRLREERAVRRLRETDPADRPGDWRVAKEALVRVEERTEVQEARLSGSKRGRPKKADSLSSTKPWDAEGISRRTWYNRQKG